MLLLSLAEENCESERCCCRYSLSEENCGTEWNGMERNDVVAVVVGNALRIGTSLSEENDVVTSLVEANWDVGVGNRNDTSLSEEN